MAAAAVRRLSRLFSGALGTLFHGKRTPVELIVRVIACLAEGLDVCFISSSPVAHGTDDTV